MIYVTHDQVEAMTMGDRICVMNDGEIVQVDEPLALYERPASLFVAGFIGSPPMNFFSGTVREAGAGAEFVEEGGAGGVRLSLPEAVARRAGGQAGRAVVLGVRPEDVREGAPDSRWTAEVVVETFEPMGADAYVHATAGRTPFVARVKPSRPIAAGQRAVMAFDLERAHLFDAATGRALR
jgi:multiple sugar transport system ATP-binding protein